MKRGNIEWLRREKRSAVLGMALFGLLQMACVIGFAALSAIPNIPRWLFILFTVLAAVCAAVLLPALWTLRKRFQELDTAKEFVSLYKEERYMLLVNIDYIPGRELEVLGIAKGTVVQSKNFGKDFMAGMKTLVGGEITSYTEMLNEARQIAVKRMVDEAESHGGGRGHQRALRLILSHAGGGRGHRLRYRGEVPLKTDRRLLRWFFREYQQKRAGRWGASRSF